MVANLGFTALFAALSCAVYAAVMAPLGAVRRRPAWLASAHTAALLTWPLITLAAGLLIVLLVTDQYQVQYVRAVTSRAPQGSDQAARPLSCVATLTWSGCVRMRLAPAAATGNQIANQKQAQEGLWELGRTVHESAYRQICAALDGQRALAPGLRTSLDFARTRIMERRMFMGCA